MKKCWICGRTGKDVDEEYTNKRHDFIADWSDSGESPDKLINDVKSIFQDDPIPVCWICKDTIEIIVEARIDEIIDEKRDSMWPLWKKILRDVEKWMQEAEG